MCVERIILLCEKLGRWLEFVWLFSYIRRLCCQVLLLRKKEKKKLPVNFLWHVVPSIALWHLEFLLVGRWERGTLSFPFWLKMSCYLASVWNMCSLYLNWILSFGPGQLFSCFSCSQVLHWELHVSFSLVHILLSSSAKCLEFWLLSNSHTLLPSSF